MVDNIDKIKPLLKFSDEHDFYFLQVIQRKKDHKNNPSPLGTSNNSRLIKAYYIYSIEQLDKYYDEIKELCKLFDARAGIALNKRNARSISLEMLSLLATNIKNHHYSQLGALYNTVCGQFKSNEDKTWILDVDQEQAERIDERDLRLYLNSQQPIGEEKVIVTIPSRNGYHVITKPFDPRSFSNEYRFRGIQIHKNNPTNLFIP